MKRILPLLFTLFLLVQCSTIKRENAHLQKLIGINELKSDVEYTYKKFQKLHPKLYYYSSKENLDYKFDSIKSTITTPLNPLGFYKKL
ncbi:MAG TPA: hypothetical protein VJ780_02360, partial [Flavobacterium sp.]|nr:hypothetical protein [Flavobacterium sp.]